MLVVTSAAMLWTLSACAAGGAASGGSSGSTSAPPSVPDGADRIYLTSELSADSMHRAIVQGLRDQGFTIGRRFDRRRYVETNNRQVSEELAFNVESRVDTIGGGGSRATIQGSYVSGMMLQRMPDTALAQAPGNVARWTQGEPRSVFRMVREVARALPHRSMSYGPEQ